MSADDPKDHVVMGRAEEIGATQERWVDAGEKLPPAKSRWRASPEETARASAEIEAARPRARRRALLDERTPPLARRLQLASGLLAVTAVLSFSAIAFHDAVRPDRQVISLPGAEPPAADPPAPPTFFLAIDSRPQAEIRVDGEARGSTPALLSTSCRPGDLVEIELSRRGYLSKTSTMPCEPGRTATLSTSLARQ